MVDKYIMMSAPPSSIWMQTVIESPDQFSKSWYVFFFLMHYLPEKWFAKNDFELFGMLNDFKFDENFTQDDLEAYKYMFGRTGLGKLL